jgi:hypothetical protein
MVLHDGHSVGGQLVSVDSLVGWHSVKTHPWLSLVLQLSVLGLGWTLHELRRAGTSLGLEVRVAGLGWGSLAPRHEARMGGLALWGALLVGAVCLA